MEFKTFQNGFRKLIAWQEAHQLTLMIYKITTSFPAEEKYGLTSQLKRASSSIAAQLAEGSRMNTVAHRKIYYVRAYASAAEVDSFLELLKDLSYIDASTYSKLLDQVNRVSALVHALIKSCESKKRFIPTAPALPTLPSIPTLPPLSLPSTPLT